MVPATVDLAPEQILATLDQARQALATIRSLPDVKHLHDQAVALQHYTQKRKYALSVQNDAAEVALRAFRRMGELLPAHVHPGNPQLSSHTTIGLKDVGISRDQSSQSQQIAALPAETFDTYIAETKASGHELTTKGVYELARAHSKAARRQAPMDPGPLLSLATQLAGLDDLARLEALGIAIQPYDVLQFQGCDPRFGTDAYPGRIPGQLIAHVLYWYTEQDAVVLDPMTGGGTVPDLCLVMGRTCYAYDLTQSTRSDIIPHNLATDGWPERTTTADLIVWDPPYFDKKDAGYPDGSISRLERGAYLDFFTKAFAEAKQMVKRGTRLAFLMSDLLPMAKARGGIPLGRTPNALPAPQAPAYLPMAKARGITQDLVIPSLFLRPSCAKRGVSSRSTRGPLRQP
jgi:hypothetical protein